MRALTVCVDFSDLLAVTLPSLQRHFTCVVIVTSPEDSATILLASKHQEGCFVTDAFHRNGASFNKGLAIEEALDYMGRKGWVCCIDADIVLPWILPNLPAPDQTCLYGANRRILDNPREYSVATDWSKYPVYPDRELGGFFHLFHADCPHLGNPPWYSINWRSAAGYDSDLEAKFPPEKKVRLPIGVLHLGHPARNWCGRVEPYLDGAKPTKAQDHQAALDEMWRLRQRFGYEKERL